MSTDEPCRFLEWDSRHFGVRIASLPGGRLLPESLEAALRWCREQEIDCLYFLADLNDPTTARLASDAHFLLTDVRVTLSRPLSGRRTEEGSPPGPSPARAGVVVRESREDDVPALRALARRHFRDSRFYFDPGFPDSLCDSLYETWIEKSCRGWADAVFVADAEGRPLGYVSCHVDDGDGRFGLLGVDAEARGRGVGASLLAASLRFFASRGVATVGLVTQGRNLASLGFFGQAGFVVRRMQLWYHLWLRPRGA